MHNEAVIVEQKKRKERWAFSDTGQFNAAGEQEFYSDKARCSVRLLVFL
jgi:hypothetical protein